LRLYEDIYCKQSNKDNNFYQTTGDIYTMDKKVKEKKEQYQQQFDNLVLEREKLVEQLNLIHKAMEQARGAYQALEGLEEDKPKDKKEKK